MTPADLPVALGVCRLAARLPAPDLTTRTTVDVAAWRAGIDARRAEAARHRALDAAALAAAHAPRPRKPRAARKSRVITPRTPRPPVIRPCTGCGRPTRPRRRTLADAPGTIRRAARDLCITCAHPAKGTGPHRPTRDPAMTARIVAAYTPGTSARQVAAEVGCTPDTVRKHLRAAGVAMRPNEGGTGSHARALALLDVNGVMSAQIRAWAGAAGVPVTTTGIPAEAVIRAYIAAHRSAAA